MMQRRQAFGPTRQELHGRPEQARTNTLIIMRISHDKQARKQKNNKTKTKKKCMCVLTVSLEIACWLVGFFFSVSPCVAWGVKREKSVGPKIEQICFIFRFQVVSRCHCVQCSVMCHIDTPLALRFLLYLTLIQTFTLLNVDANAVLA